MYAELVVTSCLLFLVVYFFGGYADKKEEEKKKRGGDDDVFVGGRLKRIPGPMTVPIFGSLPSLLLNMGSSIFSKSSFEFFDDMKAIWGSPINFQLGDVNAVIVDDIKTARKLMMSEDWANRLDDNPLWYKRSFDKHYGLLISNGEGWKEMRRFVHKVLTKHGFGRSRALEMIHEIEILNFFEHLDAVRKKKGCGEDDVVEMQGIFNVSAFNILWKMVGGGKFCYRDERVIEMMVVLEEFARGVHPRELGFLVFPKLRHVPALSGYQRIIDNHKKMQGFFLNVINERRGVGSYKEKQETFIDAFLKEIDNHWNEEEGVVNHYTDEQLAMVLVDLFITGFIPTASCLEFLVMFMILHPEIQKKCHEEIDTVIGRKRFPSINDNDKMPYTQAVCIEVLRKVTFIPMTTRAATKDTQIDDYFVPKGTVACMNIYAMHHDKSIWTNPQDFNPERFLDSEGRLLTNHQDCILPFGTGKRTCPAEVFARVSTFTYFAYLLQRYSFERVPGEGAPDETPNVGMGNYAKAYRCVIRERLLVSSVEIAAAAANNNK